VFEAIRWWLTEGSKYRRHIRALERRACEENPANGGRVWVCRALWGRIEVMKGAMFRREPYEREGARDNLRDLLLRIKNRDTDYAVRYGLVLEAMRLANKAGYETGFRIDQAEPEWPVAYIELPEGQVSWHMPEHRRPWDGHSTDEKFHRIDRFAGISV